jgi:hypothetical protein
MKMKNILENFILLAIILVIIQTFLDELAVILNWSNNTKNALIYSGLVFDSIFTIEFFSRLIISTKKGKAGQYFFYERGWVDFLASVPLLLLNSGPSAYALYTGAMAAGAGVGALNILKVVKAIRITRVLRLIRILKIFGKIKNAESKMAQRHITVIATVVCSALLLMIMVLGFLGYPGIDNAKDHMETMYKREINLYVNNTMTSGEQTVFEQLKKAYKNDKYLLKIKAGDKVFRNISEQKFKNQYYFDEVEVFSVGKIKVWLSVQHIRTIESKQNILFFSLIIFVIIAIMIIYSKHFVQTVSDVVHVMNRGMEERNYFLEAKISEHYEQDEIFQLAKNYNEKWLTIKVKHKDEIYDDTDKQEMSINDFFNP